MPFQHHERKHIMACDCGNPDATWHGDPYGARTFCCDDCWDAQGRAVSAEAQIDRTAHATNVGRMVLLAAQLGFSVSKIGGQWLLHEPVIAAPLFSGDDPTEIERLLMAAIEDEGAFGPEEE